MLPANKNILSQLSKWLTILDELQDANLALKQRLSDEAKTAGRSKELLETLEGFLNRSINKDTHIALLRQDINAQQKLSATIDGRADILGRLEKLLRDVTRMSEESERLRADFEARFENA